MCRKRSGTCFSRCLQQYRYVIRHYIRSCQSLLTASWPTANQITISQIYVSVYRATGTYLVRTKWIVICLQSCFNLVCQTVCHSEWSGHPQRALGGKQANSSQYLAAVSPCWAWQGSEREPGVGILHWWLYVKVGFSTAQTTMVNIQISNPLQNKIC